MIRLDFLIHFQFLNNPQFVPSVCFYREAIQLQCLLPTPYVNVIAMYISGVRIIRTYNIDDVYHTGRLDQSDMVKIIYIVYTCILLCSVRYNSNFIGKAEMET